MHALCLRACLQASAHHRALPLLADAVYQIEPDCDVDVVDYLTFCYYAGMALCGTRDFVGARRFFARTRRARLSRRAPSAHAQDTRAECMRAPAQAVSAVAVEAYKKFVLVSLIVDGKCAVTPPKLPQSLASALPYVAGAYQELAAASTGTSTAQSMRRKRGAPMADAAAAKAAASAAAAADNNSDMTRLERVALEYSDDLVADRNVGLLKQALVAAQRIKVKRQTKTYLTMSLSAIAKHANLPDAAAAEQLLVDMIGTGEITAKISAKDGTVVFEDESEAPSDATHLAYLNEQIKHVMVLGRRIAELEKQMQLEPEFIKKQLIQESEAQLESEAAMPVD